MGKVHLQSRSGKGSPGLGTAGAGLGNGKDRRAHLQVRDQGTLKLRGQALRQVPLREEIRDPSVMASPGKGLEAKRPVLPFICVCPQDQPRPRDSANICQAPASANNPEGFLRGPPRVLPAAIREVTGLQVKERTRQAAWRGER